MASDVTTWLLAVISACVAVGAAGTIDGETSAAMADICLAGACLRVRAGAAPPEDEGSDAVVRFLGIIPVNRFSGWQYVLFHYSTKLLSPIRKKLSIDCIR